MGNCVGGKNAKKDPKILTEDEIKLLLANTRLNRAQILALHANFLKECPNGKLTRKDFVKLFKEVHPSENKKEKADKFCEYVFNVIDKDKFGYISFQDFVLCFSLTSDGNLKDKCDFAFRLYDLDNDGKISKKDMTAVLTALYDLSGITDRKGKKAPAKKVEEIIKKINTTYNLNTQETLASSPAEAAAEQSPADAAAPVPVAEEAKPETPEHVENPNNEDQQQQQQQQSAESSKKENKSGSKAKKEKKEKVKKPAKPAKSDDGKKSSKESTTKPVKAKLPEFISKEQFIEACNSDEQLKRLFVDSIFSNSNASESNENDHLLEVADKLFMESCPVKQTTETYECTFDPTLTTAAAPQVAVVEEEQSNKANEESVITINSTTQANGPLESSNITTVTTVDYSDNEQPIVVKTITSVHKTEKIEEEHVTTVTHQEKIVEEEETVNEASAAKHDQEENNNDDDDNEAATTSKTAVIVVGEKKAEYEEHVVYVQ